MKALGKAFLGCLAILSLLGAVVVAAGGWWAMNEIKTSGPLQEAVRMTIPKGAYLGGVTDMLHHKGVITSPALFKIYAHVKGKAESIKAGEYEFPPAISMQQTLEQLAKGQIVTQQITIREGLTNFEIVRLLGNHDDIRIEQFKLLPEGRYLPETYSYALGDTQGDILRYMSGAMTKALDEEWAKRADDLPLKTKEEALILASIIEKETALSSERKMVAGVFINRLRKGMLLQTDPTVIYAIDKGAHKNDGKGPLGRRLLKKDLQFDSPYNTYLYPGLPPAPIANPGRASINAALHPDAHKYIYFVADGTGGHAFAKSLSEHNNNVTKWRKIRKKKK